jgi:electron transfer flavoprotein alpha subunit
MSVIAYIESPNGHIKKSGYEVATYAYKLAQSLGTDCKAIVIGSCQNSASIGQYGPQSILHINPETAIAFDAQSYTKIITNVAGDHSGDIIILSHSADGKSLTGRLAVRMGAGNVSGANALPVVDSGSMTVTKSVYSGKAIVKYSINTAKKVISVIGNSIQPEIVGTDVSPTTVLQDFGSSAITVIERKTSEGIVPLPEAELVVSAGRGMKGPENWGIIEELAAALGATTACSRPVADTGWRPHHEHVGQTGVAIRPNLYISAGISGAIQHLAGVNNSKVIVVINKDPEAPFFKAADYGIVGDLFDVVPKLTAAVKRFKNQ